QMSGGEREIFFGLMKRSGMAGKNLLRKALPSLDSKTGCACLSPGEWTQTGDTGTRGKEQAPAATTKSAGAKRRCPAECRQSFAGTVKAARPERSQQALPLTLTSDIRH
ncbi:hypothetical protein OUQ42_005603, partial [Klebsiella pneumoniae]